MRLRKPAALRRTTEQLADEIRFHKFVQFIFDTQWSDLRRYCNDRGIGLIGGMYNFIREAMTLIRETNKPKRHDERKHDKSQPG